jgi:hypothetical protein
MRMAQVRIGVASLALVGMLATLPLFAQFRDTPMPKGVANKELAGLKIGQTIGDIVDDSGYYEESWCTSYLAPEGSKPKLPYPKPNPDEPEQAEANGAVYLAWAMMYGPGRVHDGDPATCWAEGATGDGIGEALAVPVDATKKLRIMNGFQRTDLEYKINARARKVRVSVLIATMGFGQFGTAYLDPKVVAQGVYELKDAQGWQSLPVPAFNKSLAKASGEDDPTRGTIVVIEILSSYPGTKCKDLCVSEVSEAE